MSILRYSILPALLFVFVFTSCSKKKDDVTPSVNRADLIGKVWTATSIDFVLDGKAYNLPTDPSDTSTWEFKDNGSFVFKDSDGSSDSGKWELSDKQIKVTYDGSTDVEYISIVSLESKKLTIKSGEELDLTKKPEDYTEDQRFVYELASTYFSAIKVDISKSKKLSVQGNFTVK